MGIRESEAQMNLQKNLDFLMEKEQIVTRKELAHLLKVSEALMSRITNHGQIPGVFPFFDSIKRRFGYTIDEMLYTDLREASLLAMQKNLVPEKTFARYLGLYQIYHFRTTAYKGREYSDHAKSLRSGVVFVYRDPKNRQMHQALATFDMKKEEADDLYRQTKGLLEEKGPDAAAGYLNSLSSQTHIYQGEVEILAQQVYFTFRFDSKDRAFLIFHHAEGTSDSYIGGLGCLLSTSKGRFPKPCMQYAGIVSCSLPGAKEEIAQHLITQYPRVKIYEYMDELMASITDLYDPPKGSSQKRLSTDEKSMIIRYHIDKIVNETIEKNLGRMQVVSPEDDDDFYHYLKAVIKAM